MTFGKLRNFGFALALALAPAVAIATDKALGDDEIESQLVQIELAISAGRLTQAASMLQGLDGKYPGKFQERHAILSAELHMASGDAVAAAKAIAAMPDPTSDPCRYGGVTGWLAFQGGDWNRAISMLATSVEACPDDPGRWNLMGLALLHKNEMSAALEAFDKALSFAPSHPALLNNRALAYAYSGEAGAAIIDLEQAAHFAPDNVGIIANLALLKSNSGLDALLPQVQDSQAQALIWQKAGDGALAAKRNDVARAYYTQALLRSERFDPELWARSTETHTNTQQENADAKHD